MTNDDYIDIVIVVGVAWAALYLLNKAGTLVQNVESEISSVTQEVSSIL